ncbi:MAG: superoxide dismutase family protein [Casimicrobiaceae bacterium]
MKIALPLVAALLLCSCATLRPSKSALADLAPTKGNSVRGTVTFTQRGDHVLVVADVTGLSPGSHGFHIHEKGDCSADDATSAGGHFNPLGKPHAAPGTTDRHAGDMPMLVADANGVARLSTEIDVVTIAGGAADLLGKGLVVHKDADDFKTQPTGNSGARVACGVIRAR